MALMFGTAKLPHILMRFSPRPTPSRRGLCSGPPLDHYFTR
jgi:hypothetical protein